MVTDGNIDIDSLIPESGDWERRGNYSDNDLIDAYLLGKKKGAEEYDDNIKKMLIKNFKENYAKAHRVTEKLFSNLTNSGIDAVRAHLAIKDITSFRGLVHISESTFYSDMLDRAYELAQALSDKVHEDTFSISFSFTIDSRDEDTDALSADGYLMHYEPERKTSPGKTQ